MHVRNRLEAESENCTKLMKIYLIESKNEYMSQHLLVKI